MLPPPLALVLLALVLLALLLLALLWLALLSFSLRDGLVPRRRPREATFVGDNDLGELSCGGIGGALVAAVADAVAALTADDPQRRSLPRR